MKAELNERITRIGPNTPCGNLMRHYWQPVALVDEFNPKLDPRMGIRPVKAVRVLGQDLVLFKNAQGAFGLLDRDCPHRGADLAYGRNTPIVPETNLVIDRSLNADAFRVATGYVAPKWEELVRRMREFR